MPNSCKQPAVHHHIILMCRSVASVHKFQVFTLVLAWSSNSNGISRIKKGDIVITLSSRRDHSGHRHVEHLFLIVRRCPRRKKVYIAHLPQIWATSCLYFFVRLQSWKYNRSHHFLAKFYQGASASNQEKERQSPLEKKVHESWRCSRLINHSRLSFGTAHDVNGGLCSSLNVREVQSLFLRSTTRGKERECSLPYLERCPIST